MDMEPEQPEQWEQQPEELQQEYLEPLQRQMAGYPSLQPVLQSARSTPLISTLSNVRASPKYSIKGKPRDGRKNDYPGPGAYQHGNESFTKYSQTPKYGFGSSSRDGYSRPSSAPGPGQYSPDNPSIPRRACGFGTSVRKGGGSRSDHPGPGSYNLEGQMGKDSPKYSTTSKRAASVNLANPGPGAYQPSDSWTSKKEQQPKWGFGTSPREGRQTNNTPGPGSYSRESGLGGPKFSMRSRAERSNRNSTPGPGAHGGLYTQFGNGT
mmetsp:Transcript_109347/g.193682  ORF Transcript_109347/g.193682 Transcript_109347/m.193682 type:complete len:266 (+) Transcript_109347:72-869(+)